VGRRAAGIVVTASLMLSGCDGSTPPCSNGCWQPTPAEQSFISSFCALSVPCCASSGFASATSQSNCLTAFQRSGVSADSLLQAACLAEMQARATATLCQPDAFDLSDPCVRAVYEPSGPQQPGWECVNRDDCAGVPGTLTECLPSFGKGVCVQFAPGTGGDHTCLGDLVADGLSILAFGFPSETVARGVFCPRADGLYCAQTDDPATSVCAPLVADGAPCQSSTACASGTCNTPGVPPGTCEPTVSVGAGCLGAVCDATSYCGEVTTSSFVCMPKLSTGAPCTSSNGSLQCASGYCGSDNLCSAEAAAELSSLQQFCLGAL
jgi:hypothetical protein